MGLLGAMVIGGATAAVVKKRKKKKAKKKAEEEAAAAEEEEDLSEDEGSEEEEAEEEETKGFFRKKIEKRKKKKAKKAAAAAAAAARNSESGDDSEDEVTIAEEPEEVKGYFRKKKQKRKEKKAAKKAAEEAEEDEEEEDEEEEEDSEEEESEDEEEEDEDEEEKPKKKGKKAAAEDDEVEQDEEPSEDEDDDEEDDDEDEDEDNEDELAKKAAKKAAKKGAKAAAAAVDEDEEEEEADEDDEGEESTKMSSQEYIEAAGKETGIEVWRIEESELAPIPKKFYGTFYNGDSYVILSTKELKSGGFEWNVHFWLGEKTEQVEAGAAALWAVTVDDEVAGGAAVQHREVQGHESKAFISLFKKGLIYEEGGVASGFNHVEPNDYSEINRLLWVRGKNPVRCTQIACSWESLNKSDCFILDVGNDIYTWCGEFSTVWERTKANEMARAIRDDERGGRAEVHIIDAGEVRCPEKLCPVLGDDIPDEIPDEAPEDAPAKKGAPRSGAGKLFKVSGESGDVEYSLVAEEGPYEQSMLEDDNVFVLASADGPAIYVWKGKNSSAEERSQAIDYCNQYMEKNDLPAHTQFEIMPQFAESAMFKQFFADWQDLDETDGMGETHTVGSVAKVEHEEFDALSMHVTPETAAEFGMPDDGSGDKKVYRIVESEREEVPEENWGVFYSNECYIVLYTYETPKGKPESYVYYWLGNSAGTAAETATAFQVVQLDKEEFDGDALQVRVTEGKEPNHLIAMFNGGMAIMQQGSYCEPEPRNALFQIRLNRANQVKAFETEFSASALNSNDTFFAVAEGDSDFGFGGDCFAWFGAGADEKEKEALSKFAEKIGVENITEINEGEESDEFWEFLGGQEEYFKLPRKQEKTRLPRLFECSMATGNFVAEELLGVLHQSDLNPANVMLLDAWNTVFVWIGVESSEDEKEQTLEAAKQYLATDPAGRKGTPIVQVKQEKEPITFTGFFAGWDEEFWQNATNFEYENDS